MTIFLMSDDPITLLSPPGVTDTDGQFELALPVEGGGEIVVGGKWTREGSVSLRRRR